jgi:hypothetical protein
MLLLSLIPKKAGVVEIKNFRPISLVGGVYKIISKVLADKLKSVLGKIFQVHKMHLSEADKFCCIRSGEPGLLYKLDLEKAYDYVNLVFLLYLLNRFGFGERRRDWIEHCITMVRFSILINGSQYGFFNSSHGLRQGDLLSPLLFVVVMEVLSRMLFVTVDNGLLSGFSVGSRNHEEMIVSHLLFANGTLIFCEAHCQQLRNLRCPLCFEVVSRLKINFPSTVECLRDFRLSCSWVLGLRA